MGAAIDSAQQAKSRRPRIAVTLGDPSGIGGELVAKLLSNPANRERADIYVLCDECEFQAAVADAGGVEVAVTDGTPGPYGVRIMDDGTASGSAYDGIERGRESAASGARAMYQLTRALRMVDRGEVDAIVFAPLNKSSLKKAGMTDEDELRWFARQLAFNGTTSEINIAGPLWTGRVTSHISIAEVAERVTKERTLKAIELLHRLR